MYLIVEFVDIATHKQIIFLFLTCSLDETTKQFFSYFVFTFFYKMWLCLLWFIQSYFCVYVCHLLTPFLLKAVCITFKRDVPIWVENQTFILCIYQKNNHDLIVDKLYLKGVKCLLLVNGLISQQNDV